MDIILTSRHEPEAAEPNQPVESLNANSPPTSEIPALFFYPLPLISQPPHDKVSTVSDHELGNQSPDLYLYPSASTSNTCSSQLCPDTIEEKNVTMTAVPASTTGTSSLAGPENATYVIASPNPHLTNILFSPTHSLLSSIVPENSWIQMVPQNDTNGIFLAIILSIGIHLPAKITEPDIQHQWPQFLRQSIAPLISEDNILSGLKGSHQPLDHSILPSLSNALQIHIIVHTILPVNECVTTSNYHPSVSSSAHPASL